MYEKKIGFVILNYNTLDETLKCVSSIRERLDCNNYIIIIVDNNSFDSSGEKLISEYKFDDDIEVIRNKKNLGFASGNNIGYRVAKRKYNCQFICVLNSDTYLVQDDFFLCILDNYDKYGFSVLGPDIITPDGKKCNPVGNHIITYSESKKKIISLRIQILLNYFNLDEVIRSKISKRKKNDNYSRNEYYINVKLHGCCLIFSPKFIQKYDGFDEGTFLYLEEDLLFTHMMTDKQKTLYSPNVKIYHMEDAASNKLVKGRKKRRFVLTHHLQSMKVIKDYLSKIETLK